MLLFYIDLAELYDMFLTIHNTLILLGSWGWRAQVHQSFCLLGMGQKLKACTVGIEWVPENFSQRVPPPLSLLCCLPSSLLPTSPLPLPPFPSIFFPSFLPPLLLSSPLFSLSAPFLHPSLISYKINSDFYSPGTGWGEWRRASLYTAILLIENLDTVYNKEFYAK